MDATCNVQDSIHVFHLVHNMCPGFWVHITIRRGFIISIIKERSKWQQKTPLLLGEFLKDKR